MHETYYANTSSTVYESDSLMKTGATPQLRSLPALLRHIPTQHCGRTAQPPGGVQGCWRRRRLTRCLAAQALRRYSAWRCSKGCWTLTSRLRATVSSPCPASIGSAASPLCPSDHRGPPIHAMQKCREGPSTAGPPCSGRRGARHSWHGSSQIGLRLASELSVGGVGGGQGSFYPKVTTKSLLGQSSGYGVVDPGTSLTYDSEGYIQHLSYVISAVAPNKTGGALDYARRHL